jgi:hypothetical protein
MRLYYEAQGCDCDLEQAGYSYSEEGQGLGSILEGIILREHTEV